ncbi:DUF1878 family protein [Neobacillus sp. FSL H8-0543]|uniref:DUF1878 family protein n=1 Tax=Neobacillus sp. FSL H8-0543 TaxID=2954672 RepID=UPI00315942F3
MKENDELLYRINVLEYHQKLLLKLLSDPNLDFYRLVIEYGLSEQEVRDFFQLCDNLTEKMEEQKAEGFVYFHPLFSEFSRFLPARMDVNEVMQSCLRQKLFEPLFTEINKCL